MDIHVLKVDWADYQDKLTDIRVEVFVDEQQVPIEEEIDGHDEQSTHFIALNGMGQHVGCARLMPTGQIGRMAVRSELRGTGIGAELLKAAVAEAHARDMDKVFLHAQIHAEEFYRKGGFIGLGDRFMDAGIEHTTMEMMLPITFEEAEQPTAAPVKKEARAPGRDVFSQPVTFEGTDETLAALQTVIGHAVRNITLLSPYLDHEYFADASVVQLMSDLARSAPKAEIRILIMSSKIIVTRGHPLLELARRLDEKISIQLLDEPVSKATSSFVCVDTDSYWLLPDYDQPNGVYDLGNPVMTRRLRDTFQMAWNKSKTDPELRQLRL